VTWQHNSNREGKLKGLTYQILYKFSDKVIADSEAVLQKLKSQKLVTNEKLSKVTIAGIDAEKYKKQKKKRG
jgi:hypothetical protein